MRKPEQAHLTPYEVNQRQSRFTTYLRGDFKNKFVCKGTNNESKYESYTAI